MGCAASKIDNEDVVRRCKERRRLMKEAVCARHHLAGAHADYCRSLQLTGTALSDFATNEPLSVSDNTPAVFLHPDKPAREPYAPPPFPKHESQEPSPPPPPPPTFPPSRSSNSTATTTPPPKLPPILSTASTPLVNPTRRRARPKPAMKLPHILSESSPSSSPRSMRSNFTNANASTNPNFNFYPTAYSTYSSTPSQASSVWNWENFYPPSPPDSEYFNQKEMMMKNDKRRDLYHQNPSGSDFDEDENENETSASEYDFFHSKPPKGSLKTKSQMENSSFKHGEDRTSLDGGGETEREEVQCSEWGDHDHDHYSSSSSSEDENGIRGAGLEEDVDASSEIGTRSNYGSARRGSVTGESVKVGPRPGFGKLEEEEEEDEAESSTTMSYGNAGHVRKDMLKMVVRHKDLKEIVDAIRENFEMAAKAGDQVSEMLEIGRAQLDRSFRRLKKTVYHSSSVLSNLSSTWTSKPPLAVKYRLDAASLNDQGGPKSLCSTLDRLLAWEKKLYEEVKAREGVKIAHEKKLSALQSQEYKGEDETKIDKTKTSIKKLQSLIIVTSQAVSTTSTAILGLRDSDLVPQLVELCHGFMYMWRSMHQYHEIQNSIVQQVRGLVNQARKGESTSELHRQATRNLESAVFSWHSSFCRLIKFQRDFIRSLHGWFKLTLLPVDGDNTNGNLENSDVYAFCDEWKLALDRVPDTVASEAIKSFINVVHVISAKQTEELKIKKRTEAASKELERKAASLRNIEKKYYHSYSMVGLGLPDSGRDNGQVLDARDPLAEKKVELASCQRRVEDEMLRHSKAVEVTRAMTLNNLQTGLPGVFQALTSFSSLFMDALETVCTRSYAIK